VGKTDSSRTSRRVRKAVVDGSPFDLVAADKVSCLAIGPLCRTSNRARVEAFQRKSTLEHAGRNQSHPEQIGDQTNGGI